MPWRVRLARFARVRLRRLFLFYAKPILRKNRLFCSLPCQQRSLFPEASTSREHKLMRKCFAFRARHVLACVAGAWKQWAQAGEKRAREKDPLRVSLARARSLFRPLLPSACYAGQARVHLRCINFSIFFFLTNPISHEGTSKTVAVHVAFFLLSLPAESSFQLSQIRILKP